MSERPGKTAPGVVLEQYSPPQSGKAGTLVYTSALDKPVRFSMHATKPGRLLFDPETGVIPAAGAQRIKIIACGHPTLPAPVQAPEEDTFRLAYHQLDDREIADFTASSASRPSSTAGDSPFGRADAPTILAAQPWNSLDDPHGHALQLHQRRRCALLRRIRSSGADAVPSGEPTRAVPHLRTGGPDDPFDVDQESDRSDTPRQVLYKHVLHRVDDSNCCSDGKVFEVSAAEYKRLGPPVSKEYNLNDRLIDWSLARALHNVEPQRVVFITCTLRAQITKAYNIAQRSSVAGGPTPPAISALAAGQYVNSKSHRSWLPKQQPSLMRTDLLLVPVCRDRRGSEHWVLAAVFGLRRAVGPERTPARLLYVNSLNQPCEPPKEFPPEMVCTFLARRAMAEADMVDLQLAPPPAPSEGWYEAFCGPPGQQTGTLLSVDYIQPPQVPEQVNAHDCGIHLIAAADALAQWVLNPQNRDRQPDFRAMGIQRIVDNYRRSTRELLNLCAHQQPPKGQERYCKLAAAARQEKGIDVADTVGILTGIDEEHRSAEKCSDTV